MLKQRSVQRPVYVSKYILAGVGCLEIKRILTAFAIAAVSQPSSLTKSIALSSLRSVVFIKNGSR
jgi:hypothetical protein